MIDYFMFLIVVANIWSAALFLHSRPRAVPVEPTPLAPGTARSTFEHLGSVIASEQAFRNYVSAALAEAVRRGRDR